MLPKQTEYKAGIYLRLSRDDEHAGESLSIENQRTILTRYIEGTELEALLCEDKHLYNQLI